MQSAESRSDLELFELAISGDESAFLILYERLKTGIFRYAYYMTGSRFAAEEVTQEVFLTLLQNRADSIRSRVTLARLSSELRATWCAGSIAGSVLLSRCRTTPKYSPGSSGRRRNHLDQLVQDQLIGNVRAAVASLPEHYRQVVVLCDLCEMTYADAATRMGCAVGTVRSRLNRGHKLLAEKLKLQRETQTAFRNTGTEGCLI